MAHHQLPISYLQWDQPLNGWSRRLHLHRTRVRMVGCGRGWAGCVVDRAPRSGVATWPGFAGALGVLGGHAQRCIAGGEVVPAFVDFQAAGNARAARYSSGCETRYSGRLVIRDSVFFTWV